MGSAAIDIYLRRVKKSSRRVLYFFIFSWSSEMKLLTPIVALFMMAQAPDEVRGRRIHGEAARNLRSLGLPSKVTRQACKRQKTVTLGEEPRNLRSLGLPESQEEWGRQKRTAKKTNAEALKDLSSMKRPERMNQGWHMWPLIKNYLGKKRREEGCKGYSDHCQRDSPCCTGLRCHFNRCIHGNAWGASMLVY